ncbi:MAG TPA: hypothetical protein VFW51_07735 [Actinomycetota bacterium]|nr:hypothetical protein [Actinomycetota bacterium]
MRSRAWSLVASLVVIAAIVILAALAGGTEPDISGAPSGDGSALSPAGAVPDADGCEEPAGPLEQVGVDSYVSEGGLAYPPDQGRFESRADHVLAHTQDDLSRPLHGIFDVGSDHCRVFDLLDEVRARIDEGEGRRCGDGCYDVDLDRSIGMVGGTQGAADDHPHTTWVRIVVENGDDVITAYPILP